MVSRATRTRGDASLRPRKGAGAARLGTASADEAVAEVTSKADEVVTKGVSTGDPVRRPNASKEAAPPSPAEEVIR